MNLAIRPVMAERGALEFAADCRGAEALTRELVHLKLATQAEEKTTLP